VRQAHLSRARNRAAADEAGIGDRMVGRAERPGRHQSGVGGQQAGDGVDLGTLPRLLEREWRKDRHDPLRQHRLARARRTHKQDILVETPAFVAVLLREPCLKLTRTSTARQRGISGRAPEQQSGGHHWSVLSDAAATHSWFSLRCGDGTFGHEDVIQPAGVARHQIGGPGDESDRAAVRAHR
jgi:hypothetical protein